MNKALRLADVARAAGVSQGTASNVFNRPDLVRPEVREHVEATARALGYAGPNPKGRLLRAGRVNAIGVASAEPLSYFFDDPFARSLMTGISQACDRYGAGIALISAANDRKLDWNIRSALVDGSILLCIERGPELVALSRERQLPFVALELETADETISAIGIDNVAGAREAARHLAALGHRRFAVLAYSFADDRSGPVSMKEVAASIYSSSRDRVTGYFAGLAEFDIETASVPIYETENEERSVHAALDYVFAAPEPPTALLAMSDRIALIAMDWLKGRGKSVPRDVSIVGFDGVPEAEASSPPLTTIAQPIADMGRLAVEMILGESTAPRQERLALRLELRASTAPPPQ